MRFLVTAEFTSGEQPRLEMRFETEEQARSHADWLFSASGYHTVEMQEEMGVELTYTGGRKVFESAPNIAEACNVAASWNAVAANHKINRSPVRKAEVVGIRYITAVATPEDIAIGAWHAAALEDPKVCPSMKYDINRWMDSKEWP